MKRPFTLLLTLVFLVISPPVLGTETELFTNTSPYFQFEHPKTWHIVPSEIAKDNFLLLISGGVESFSIDIYVNNKAPSEKLSIEDLNSISKNFREYAKFNGFHLERINGWEDYITKNTNFYKYSCKLHNISKKKYFYTTLTVDLYITLNGQDMYLLIITSITDKFREQSFEVMNSFRLD